MKDRVILNWLNFWFNWLWEMLIIFSSNNSKIQSGSSDNLLFERAIIFKDFNLG